MTPADMLHNLEYRLVGPFRGGRVAAVAGDPFDSQVFYFGSTGGGVWKTYDGGIYWENVSDGFFQRASVGAIAVATVRSERRVRRNGRELHPRQRLTRRWRLPLD